MKHIIYRNKKILYRAEGKGIPVILLHGFAEKNDVWNFQLNNLKQDFFVLLPDLPGSGNSELLQGDIRIEDYADVVKAIADAENIGGKENPLVLIGHSMGGYITLAFAKKYPGCLKAFGLFHSSAYADDESKKETRRRGIEFIQNNGAYLFLKTSTPNLFSEKTKKECPSTIDDLLELSKDFSSEALIQYYNAMIQRPDYTSVFKTFKKPVLFLTGKDDKAVPLKVSLEQCHLPFVSYFNILKNSGHMGMWEEKELATAFLRQFLMEL